MPIPAPAGSLPAAFRVCCVRCVRRLETVPTHTCNFISARPSECAYCTIQRDDCVPLPWFVHTEFTNLQVAMKSGSASNIMIAATELNRVLQVAQATAVVRDDAGNLSLGLVEENRSLRQSQEKLIKHVEDIAESVKDMVRLLTTISTSSLATAASAAENSGAMAELVKKRSRSDSDAGPAKKVPRVLVVKVSKDEE